MKILIVTQYFWPERFKINDIADGFVERGHHVTVLTGLPNYPHGKFFEGYSLLGPYIEKKDNIRIIRVPLIPRGSKRGLMLALNYFSFLVFSMLSCLFFIGSKFDRIFVYQLSPVTSALPAIPLRFITGAKVHLWVTDLWPETLQATNIVKSEISLKLWGILVKFLYDKCDEILVSSKGFINKINDRGIPLNKLKYWPQWAEQLFSDGVKDKNLLPVKELPSNGFKIMFAGNIGTSQSFDTIVDAAETLKIQGYKDIKWLILGDGLQKNWVEQEITKRNLNDCFYLLGSKPLESMPYYYALSDVLLASLKQDPLFSITVPAKVQSYLPSGKPILVSMDGEAADLILEAEAGVHCKASSVESLVEGVLKLYNMTKEERDLMGKKGREFFFKNFEREKLLDKLIEKMSL